MIINQYEIANNSVKNMDKIYEDCFSKKETLKTNTNKKKRFKFHSNKEMHARPNYTFVSIRASVYWMLVNLVHLASKPSSCVSEFFPLFEVKPGFL